jgi:hypothetical protein
MRYVYIGNFGYCWRLTVEAWRAICEAGVAGEGYDLSPYRQLRRFPSWLERGEDSDQRYNTRNDRLYYEPLDWSAEDFAGALSDLETEGRLAEPVTSAAEGQRVINPS